ncbi:MAG: hypothetical protein WCT16_03470 [Candidatus Buchananbacteria bacterium]
MDYYNLLNPDPAMSVDLDLQNEKSRVAVSKSNAKYREAIKRLKELEAQLSIINAINSDHCEAIAIKAKGPFKKTHHSQAVAVINCSDWHVGELVDPKTVNGKNSFNVDICRKRVNYLSQNGLRLVDMFAQDVTIDTIMLACLGDFVTNYLHPDNNETNTLAPAPEVVEAYRLLKKLIVFLLDNSKYKIVIPCCFGNHARMTDKKRNANMVGTSSEYIIYHLLADYFENEPRVQFDIAEGMHLYASVFGMKLRLHHGDGINFYGGVGGLEIPLRKSLAQWDKVERVDFDFLGHWHQTKVDWNKYAVNGSLIGWNAFALKIKADYEPPRQTLLLLDRDRGLTVVCPIILSEVQRQIYSLS